MAGLKKTVRYFGIVRFSELKVHCIASQIYCLSMCLYFRRGKPMNTSARTILSGIEESSLV